MQQRDPRRELPLAAVEHRERIGVVEGVAAAVLAMTRTLRIRSVAQGIEDPESLEIVCCLGCDEVQGNYISPPLKARDFADWLESGGAAELAQGRAAALAIELEASKIEVGPALRTADLP